MLASFASTSRLCSEVSCGAAVSCSPAASVGAMLPRSRRSATNPAGETERESAPAATSAASSPNSRRETREDFVAALLVTFIVAFDVSELFEDDVDTEV